MRKILALLSLAAVSALGMLATSSPALAANNCSAVAQNMSPGVGYLITYTDIYCDAGAAQEIQTNDHMGDNAGGEWTTGVYDSGICIGGGSQPASGCWGHYLIGWWYACPHPGTMWWSHRTDWRIRWWNTGSWGQWHTAWSGGVPFACA